jgi:hypothetical protein
LRAFSISSGDIVSSGWATSAGGGSIFADSATSAGGDSDVRPLPFFGEPLDGDLRPDAFLDFLAAPDFVFVSDDFVSELDSDDCASELGLALDFLADVFALPIT